MQHTVSTLFYFSSLRFTFRVSSMFCVIYYKVNSQSEVQLFCESCYTSH